MEFKTAKDFIKYIDESRKTTEANKLNIDKLDKYFAIAEVVKEIFAGAKIEVEQPQKDIRETNITIIDKSVDFEDERKYKLLKVLENVDGFSFSGIRERDKKDGQFMIVLTVENIWYDED